MVVTTGQRTTAGHTVGARSDGVASSDGGDLFAQAGPGAAGAGEAMVNVDVVGFDPRAASPSRWAVRSCSAVETRA